MGGDNPLRQKMINMMYLVLTALLALNVSSDILKAFGLVNRGLMVTNDGFASKNSFLMTQFTKLKEADKKAAGPYDTAILAQAEAKLVFDKLQAMKEDLAKAAGGWTDSAIKQTVVSESDLEIPQRYFIEEVKEERGEKLRLLLADFRKKMLALGDPKMDMGFTEDMLQKEYKEKDGTKKKWDEYYFEGKPVVAAITLLSKFQTDVKSAETDVIQFNIKKVGAKDFKFDMLQAIISLETPSVSPGDAVKAKVVVGAYDSKNTPTITVGGRALPIKDGVGIYETKASGLGEQTISGVATVKGPDGTLLPLNFKTSYQVFVGSATISATKMNMLYIGLDNPISVSAGGARPDQTVVQCSQPSMMRMVKTGEYVIKPTGSVREISVTVSIKSEGGIKKAGSMSYRVRPVPKAEILLGTRQPGPISRGELTTISQVNAGYGASFAFEGLPIFVTSYVFTMAQKTGGKAPIIETVTGRNVTPGMRNAFNSAKPGDVIVIGEVKTGGAAPGTSNGGVWTVR